MLVTEIKKINTKKSRIFTDSDYDFPLYNMEIKKFHIELNKDISLIYDDINKVLLKRAFERVINILKNSDKTESDIIKSLKKSYYPIYIIEETLKKIKDAGYINDLEYAKEYASSHISYKSMSYIKNKLREKGIAVENFDEIFSDFDSEYLKEQEIRQIKKELAKKVGIVKLKLLKIEDGYEKRILLQSEMKKIMTSLLRKGYKYNDIKEEIKKCF